MARNLWLLVNKPRPRAMPSDSVCLLLCLMEIVEYLKCLVFRFRRPTGNIDQRLLLQFMGAEFNMNLQAIDRPVGTAPNAFQFLPLEGLGSGGRTWV